MKLGIQFIICWTIAMAFGGAFAGSMVIASDADHAYQVVAAH